MSDSNNKYDFVFKQKDEELTLYYGDPEILPDGEAEYLMTIHRSLLDELAEVITKLKENKNRDRHMQEINESNS